MICCNSLMLLFSRLYKRLVKWQRVCLWEEHFWLHNWPSSIRIALLSRFCWIHMVINVLFQFLLRNVKLIMCSLINEIILTFSPANLRRQFDNGQQYGRCDPCVRE